MVQVDALRSAAAAVRRTRATYVLPSTIQQQHLTRNKHNPGRKVGAVMLAYTWGLQAAINAGNKVVVQVVKEEHDNLMHYAKHMALHAMLLSLDAVHRTTPPIWGEKNYTTGKTIHAWVKRVYPEQFCPPHPRADGGLQEDSYYHCLL